MLDARKFQDSTLLCCEVHGKSFLLNQLPRRHTLRPEMAFKMVFDAIQKAASNQQIFTVCNFLSPSFKQFKQQLRQNRIISV